ncbi:MAG: Xaa-Pro peptidase family protein, partial [Thermoprotei archaeon]
MKSSLYNERIKMLKESMSASNVQAIIVSPGVNMTYLTGWSEDSGERPLLLIVTPDSEPWIFTPELYSSQIRLETPVTDAVVWKDGENMGEKLASAFRERVRTGMIGVESGMRLEWYFSLTKALNGSEFTSANTIFQELRSIKTDMELQLISYASDLACRAISYSLEHLTHGMSERAFARILENRMIELGADDRAFATIVASGGSSAMPHHRASSRPIERGEPLVVDFGARYKLYNTDMTRTFFVGTPTKEFSEAYLAVKEAQLIGVESALEGVRACDVDRKVREFLSKRGFGRNFVHRTGHGIGLEVHEQPFVDSSSTTKLKDG